MSGDDWHQGMAVHLRGAFLMSRAAQSFMTALAGDESLTCAAFFASERAGFMSGQAPYVAGGWR